MPDRIYEDHYISGWRVTTEAGGWQFKEDTLRILGDRLVEIEAVLPSSPLALLKTVQFFVDSTPWFKSPLCYHHSGCGAFLSARKEPVDKLRTINVLNPERFIPLASDASHFPGTVLHELAHAYHDQFMPQGYSNLDVITQYNRTKEKVFMTMC